MRKGCSENKGKPLSRLRGLRGRRAPSCLVLGDTSHQGGRASPALMGLCCAQSLCARSSGGCWELSRVRRHPSAPATRLPGAGPALPLGPARPSPGAGKTSTHPPSLLQALPPAGPGVYLQLPPLSPEPHPGTQSLLLPCWQVSPAAASRDQSEKPHGL